MDNNTTTVLIAAIAAIAGIVNTIVSVKTKNRIEETNNKVEGYHKEVNSKMSEYIALKESESKAKQEVAGLTGHAAGIKENQAATDAKKPEK